MRRGLLAVMILMSVFSAARAAENADSLARALATFWGTAFKTDDLDATGRREFVRGLREILSSDSTARTAYMRGASMAFNVLDGYDRMEQLGLNADRDVLIRSLVEVAEGKNVGFTAESAGTYIDKCFKETTGVAELSPESQTEFLAAAAAIEGAITTPSGLVFRVITEGEGTMPTEGDQVKLNYRGMLSDGTVFDVTDEPTIFDVARFIPGMTEGLKMMKPGGRYDLVIPAPLAYGEKGVEGFIPPGAALHFIVDLISIV